MRTTIRSHVAEFHELADIPLLREPSIPPNERVRLRARLITEEYLELMQSLYRNNSVRIAAIGQMIEFIIANEEPEIDLAEFADATCDLDYVVEGSRLEFGIDGYPIAKAIHEANMKKVEGNIERRNDDKILKPEGWKPADIDKLLEEQGWKRTTV